MDSQEKVQANERLIKAKQERDDYVHRSFFMLLEFVFIFGLPKDRLELQRVAVLTSLKSLELSF